MIKVGLGHLIDGFVGEREVFKIQCGSYGKKKMLVDGPKSVISTSER